MSLLRRRAAELARRVPSFSRAPSSSFSRASSSSTVDVATEAEVKADSLLPMEQEGDAVGFAQTRLTWKPRPSSQRVAVETSQLFCASNDPLEQTAEDAGRFFQLDGSTNAFDVFYHNGYCGENVASRNAHLKTSAMMVRREGIRLRDDLLNLDSNSNLADAAGWILAGEKGVGKSMVLNYILAAMQRALAAEAVQAEETALSLLRGRSICATGGSGPEIPSRTDGDSYQVGVSLQRARDAGTAPRAGCLRISPCKGSRTAIRHTS